MPTLIELDDVTPRIAYTATAGQLTFVIPFVFFEDDDADEYDVLMYVDGTLKTPGTYYTVAGALDSLPASRLLTVATAMVGGESVVIVRDIPIARTTNFPVAGPFSIDALNLQLAKLFAIQQQLEDSIARTLRLADSDPVNNLTLPAAATRASKYLFFDASGNPTAVASVSTSVAALAFWVTVLSTTNTAAAARTALGIIDQSVNTALSNWHLCR